MASLPGRVTGITVVVDGPEVVAKRLADGFDVPRDGATAVWFGSVRVELEAPGADARPTGVFALRLEADDAARVANALGDRPCGMRIDVVPAGARTAARGAIALDHVGVASADNTACVALLCGRAGFPLESEQTDLEYRIPVETFVSNRYGVVQHAREPEPVGGLRVSFVTVGEFELELLQDLDTSREATRSDGPGNTRGDRTAIARYVARRGAGLHHLAFRVSDIDARLDRLALARLELIDRRGRPGSRRARIAFVHPRALGGLLIHLVER
jgi:catechol 2,3-dioxygenase-like lactoylglutathione lyase family enzyme